MKTPFRNFVALALAATVVLLATVTASAATLTVTTGSDDYSPGTLRSVIDAAEDGDTIVFDPSVTYVSLLNSGLELYIDKNLTIAGSGQTVWGGGARVFEIADGAQVAISGLDIAGGGGKYYSGINGVAWGGDDWDNVGGGILNFGSLTLSNCSVSDNFLDAASSLWILDGRGGGIANFGTMTIENSTVSGNVAYLDYYGGGGGIYNAGLLMLDSSSVVKNSADGIWNDGGDFDFSYATGVLIVVDSFIKQNKPSDLLNFGELSVDKKSRIGKISP